VTSPGSTTSQQTRRRAVAGYDFTFSLPKSASVLWAIADADTQANIAEAHHRAIHEVLAFIERELAATRAGEAGRDGAVAQVEVTGLIAAAFDHFDSRAGDPQLHTHVVVSNKVRTVFDGKWRSLDGRPLHAATVAISELHNAVFADHLTRALGVGWERREREADRNPVWAIAAVPEELVAEFSSRSRHIDIEKDRLIDEYIAAHGRVPSKVTVIRLRQQATLSTRPEKQLRSLADLAHEWRARATRLLGRDATT
jgi:conjugative relaxase-like TrwC/TraI family protein